MPRLTLVLILTILATSSISAEEKSPPEFPFKVDGFVSRYNLALKTLHVPAKKISIKEQKEEDDTIVYTLHQSNGNRKFMLIRVTSGNESKRIRAIFYMGGAEKGQNAFFFSLTLTTEIEAVIMALESPVMTKEERDKRVEEIGLQESIDQKRYIASTENFVDYSVGPMKSIGVIAFQAQPNPEHFYNK